MIQTLRDWSNISYEIVNNFFNYVKKTKKAILKDGNKIVKDAVIENL
jgi:hypothetical protein